MASSVETAIRGVVTKGVFMLHDFNRKRMKASGDHPFLTGIHEPMEEELTADIRGRDLVSGLPRTIQFTTENVREALAEPVSAIVDAVKTTLDKTPPELAADIMEDGITLTGGGALLGGLRQRLAHETGMPIRVAPEPLYSVVIGSGRALENIDAMRGLMSLGGDD